LVSGDFAAAEIHRFIFSGVKCHRGEWTPLMRTIAKWLAFAFPTGTPIISFATFNGNGVGAFLGDYRFHFLSP
jgi:hypothetical protein